jgi:hypothetical protein
VPGLFKRRSRTGLTREAVSEDRKHLEEWAANHRGVEAFVEPQTTVTATTVVLVAADGEWTRRRVPSPRIAHEWANNLGMASYDAAVVGYPQRMRDFNARRKIELKRLLEDD